MIGYITYIFSFFYKGPIIKNISKTSIMGNLIDKTYDYYFGTMKISPLDTDYLIEYYYKNNLHKVSCDFEKLESNIEEICNLP